MIAKVNTPPAGIPAAPTLDAVAVTLVRRQKKGINNSKIHDRHKIFCGYVGYIQDGNDLDEVEGIIVELCNENGSRALKAGGSIHVDGGADGKDEAADLLGDAVIFLHALHHKWKRGGAARGM